MSVKDKLWKNGLRINYECEVKPEPGQCAMSKLLIGLLCALLLSWPVFAADCTVDKAGYQALKTGMTYKQVAQILGCEGEGVSENEIAGFHTIMYKWYGKDGISNMNVMFQNGRLMQKSQFGLK
jgi:hypothetical protein